MSNPIITSLPEYVDQHSLPLLAEAVLGGKSASLFTLATGVKHSTALNLLSTDVQFGDGSTCGWDPSGSQELSQRVLNVGNIKINMPYCERELLKTYLSHQVKIAAGAETLPFEEVFIGEVMKNIKALVEKAIYQGDTASDTNNLKYFDGLLKILTAEGDIVKVTASTEGSAYDKVMAVYTALPEKAFERGNVVILVGSDVFRKFTQDLVQANLYHYNPGAPTDETLIPGTDIQVIGVPGLSGTKKAIGASLNNLVYGTDMLDDEETFDFWYSKDNQEFRLAVKFNAGVQVGFPDEIVLATL